MRIVLIASFCALLSACTSIERLAIPDATLLAPELAEQGQQEEISHAHWDSFLKRYTRLNDEGIVLVNYGAVTQHDKAQLDLYLSQLAAIDVTTQPRDEQLAYWINLYNSLTVKTVLEHYPVASIREIRTSFLDPGPWDEKRITVAGRALSLHDIEHGIVRAIWKGDPRIHYALNCAALSCPNLAQRAYTAKNLEYLLHNNAIAYVNDPRGVYIKNDLLTMSKIYAWYEEDYGDSEKGVLDHLHRYAAPALRTKLATFTSIDRYRYDWALNDVALD